MIVIIIIPISTYGKDIENNNFTVLEIVTSQNTQTTWINESIVSADINCDGENNFAIIGTGNEEVKLTIIVGPIQNNSKTITLEFGLGDSMSQASMCGDKPKLKLESHDKYT